MSELGSSIGQSTSPSGAIFILKRKLKSDHSLSVNTCLALLPWITGERALSQFPLVGKELGTAAKRRKWFLEDASARHKTGYKKFRNMTYRREETDGDVIVLPVRYLEESRKFPDDVISVAEATREIQQTHYLQFSSDDPLLNHTIRSDLTHSLPRINDRLSAEVKRTVPEFLGTAREWTPVNVNSAMLKMVVILSGNIFLGPELNRREEYIHASIHYTVDLFNAANQLREWRRWMRPIGQYLVPNVKAVAEHGRRAREFLVPIVRAPKAQLIAQDGAEEPDDMLQWVIKKADRFGQNDDDLAQLLLSLSLTAIHTTTMMTTFVQASVRSIPEIQAEIKTVLAEHDGVMTTQALYQIKLLDTVMRESQRYNPINLNSFHRKVLKDVELSDGTVLPKGRTIMVPQCGVNFDPAIYPDPLVYNPYHFYDIRTGKAEDPLKYSNKEQHQFISVNKENTTFGFGRHACPGRFFASNEIKHILARMLVDYEMKLPAGETTRFPNLKILSTIAPDPTKNVMFKYVGA
ncbi:cytochrome P450 [Microdochium bolleyi]|uniref:Cytochrome P450 n=1 Tax=Microdochium bolleyi TaxID=196109 RepID=A0A136J623_9PEZI|nr:cytochrome P450 [Microdochium bolleyi]